MKIRLALLSLILLSSQASATPPTYTVTDLGTLGGTFSFGAGINDGGQVTGWVGTPGTYYRHAFLYNGTMNDLGTLDGGNYSAGLGINNSGQVTGDFTIAGDQQYRAFLYSGGTMHDLGTLGIGPYNGDFSEGQGINASGQIAGWSNVVGNGIAHAFLWSPTTPNGTSGTMQDLGTLGGDNSAAAGINDSGWVTGNSDTNLDAASHAFLYNGTTMLDLGSLTGPTGYSSGLAINDSGQVTGLSYISGGAAYHAFLYSGGTMNDLGTLGGTDSEADGINASGQIVGDSSTTGNADDHAFLYTGGQMYDLNTLISPSSGWDLREAYAINDSGQITGYGTIDGETHAFLLTEGPVPEPSTFVLALVGLPAVFFLRRRFAKVGD